MKNLSFVFLLVLLLVACTPPAPARPVAVAATRAPVATVAPTAFPHPILGWDELQGQPIGGPVILGQNVKLAQVSGWFTHVDQAKLAQWASKFKLDQSNYYFLLCVGCTTPSGSPGETSKVGDPVTHLATGAIWVQCRSEATTQPGGLWACGVHEMVHAEQLSIGEPIEEAEAYAVDAVITAYDKGCQQYTCYKQVVGIYVRAFPDLKIEALPEERFNIILGWAKEIGSFIKP